MEIRDYRSTNNLYSVYDRITEEGAVEIEAAIKYFKSFKSNRNKTASGNLAFHPVARTRLTERAKSPTMENRNAVYSKNSRFAHNSSILPPLQK